MKNAIFQLTPLGKAHYEVKEYLHDRLGENDLKRYETSLNHYRTVKVVQAVLKVFLYAGIITSAFATFGLEQAFIIQKIASYVGVSVIFVLYAVTSYITMIRREAYHVQREILISKATREN